MMRYYYTNLCVSCHQQHVDYKQKLYDYYYCNCYCSSSSSGNNNNNNNQHDRCNSSEIIWPNKICEYCSIKRNCCQRCEILLIKIKCHSCNTDIEYYEESKINRCHLCDPHIILCDNCVFTDDINHNNKIYELDICINNDIYYCSNHKDNHLRTCNKCKEYYDLIS